MLTIRSGNSVRFCDGTTRRGFLQLGALGFAGLTFADLLRAEANAGVGSSRKALINIHLGGGPSHQDIFDLKPNAPAEYRGEFNPIPTNVSGLDICEHLPKLAQLGDKFAVIRALVGSNAGHSNYQTMTGYNQKSLESLGGRPAIGSVVSKLQGSAEGGAPPYVAFNRTSPGYLGPTYSPFAPSSSGLANLSMNRYLDAERLRGRVNLLGELDRLRRDIDSSGQMEALDSYAQTAVDIVTSGRLADALDLKKEDPRIVENYGRAGETLLKARRLIEAGVRVITTDASFGGWDTHSNNFKTLRTRNLPSLDQGISALLMDLDARGMLDDVTIVMWGEFGRTPRVDNDGGRNHWPPVSMAFMAGGGLRTGQAVGETTKYAETAKNRPVHFQEVHATLYHNLGINPGTTQFIDPAGRPQYLLEHNTPISELI